MEVYRVWYSCVGNSFQTTAPCGAERCSFNLTYVLINHGDPTNPYKGTSKGIVKGPFLDEMRMVERRRQVFSAPRQ
jgi:uncharacterized protein (DUF2147 family)